MSTNEFDRLIAEKMSEVSYEYEAGDWNNLTTQLAAARRKKRGAMLIYLTSGIAASVAIFIVGIMPMFSKKEVPAAQYSSKSYTPQQIPATSPAPSTNNSINNQLSGLQNAGQYNSSATVVRKEQGHAVLDTTVHNTFSVADNHPQTNDRIQQEKEQTDAAAPEQNEYGTLLPLSYTETQDKAEHKGINVSVAGGVNYGTINTGYAIGAAAGKKLSNKFGVEVAIAYVGNSATSPSTGPQSMYTPPNGNMYVKPTAGSSVPLNYLQCAPMADYSLSQKITLSAGADLQRLLYDHNVSVFYNDNVKVAPQIDLGMLLRTEYSISNHLKAGLSYRIGANNFISSGNNYIDRNYMQVQLKYRLH